MKRWIGIFLLLLLPTMAMGQYYSVFDSLETKKGPVKGVLPFISFKSDFGKSMTIGYGTSGNQITGNDNLNFWSMGVATSTGKFLLCTSTITDTTTKASVITDTTNGIRLKNGATVWEDIRVAGTSVRGGSSAPSFVAGTRTGGIFLTWYAGTGTDDEGHTAIQMPHAWESNTSIYPHFHIYPEVIPSGAQDTVVFGIEYMWMGIGDTALTPNETDTVTGFLVVTPTNYRSHLMLSLDSLIPSTFSPTTKGESSMLMLRIFRPATTDARDTYEQPCALLEFDAHYRVNKMGSKNELP